MFPIFKDKSESLRFHCTGCDACCRNTFIDLTFPEAKGWAQSGGKVALGAAMILESHIAAEGVAADFVRAKTLAAQCGTRPVRVWLSLLANIEGDCHNLKNNQRQIYDKRPLVCRTYPAEADEAVDLFPVYSFTKGCPDESWDASGKLFQKGSVLKHPGSRAAVIEFQKQRHTNIPILHHLADAVQISTASFEKQGHLIYLLNPENISTFLDEASKREKKNPTPPAKEWGIYVPERQQQRFAEAGFKVVALPQTSPAYTDMLYNYTPGPSLI